MKDVITHNMVPLKIPQSPTTIEGILVALLLADAGVAALIGNRISPVTDPQVLALPKLTYQRLRTQRDAEIGGFTNDGPTGYCIAVFQIDCWSLSALTAKQTISAVRIALNGVATGIIGCIRVVDEKTLDGGIYSGQQKPIQRQLLEIAVQFSEDII